MKMRGGEYLYTLSLNYALTLSENELALRKNELRVKR